MVSINNNLGIGALKATAKAETAGIQKDDGQVTVKERALFPEGPVVLRENYRYPKESDLKPIENYKCGDVIIAGKLALEVKGEQNPDGTWDLWYEEIPYSN